MNRPLITTLLRLATVLLLGFALSNQLPAQATIPIQDEHDIVAKYGIEFAADGRTTTIAEAYGAAGAKAKFPWLYARYTQAVGLTEAEIGQFSLATAARENEVWGTHPGGFGTTSAPAWCASRIAIKWQHGKWYINRQLTAHFGRDYGNGPGYVYPDPRSPSGYGGTTLQMATPDKWVAPNAKDMPSVRIDDLGTGFQKVYTCFVSTTWGNDGTIGAYHELWGLRDMHINGACGFWWVPGRLVVGVSTWDWGSASVSDNIYCTNIDVGIMCVRATPAEVRKLTCMDGNVAGVVLLGTAGATGAFIAYECDDFPQKVLGRRFYRADGTVDREGGGAFSFSGGAGKLETGITPEKTTAQPTGRGRWNGTIIANLEGQFCFDFTVDQIATGYVKVEALFVLNPRTSNGNLQNCLLTARVKRFECNANWVHEVNGRVFPSSVGPFGSAELFWTTTGKVQENRVDVAPLPGVVGAPFRLGYQRWDMAAQQWLPAFNHATRTPIYPYSQTGTTTPNPCTYTYSAWSACTNGTQTRTVLTSFPAGCTGTPVTTQSCTSAPSAAVYTANNVTVSSGSYSLDIADITISRIVLTGYTQTGTPNYSAFAVPPGAISTGYISIFPDGTWNTPAGRCNVTTANGVTTITLPAPMTISRLGTWQGQGGALQYRATRVELFP